MRPGLFSKHPKKNAEERSKRKKMKSNKRRRHDSPSSSSYSSDWKIDVRSRKKSARWKPKKPEKRRKEPKKLVKKKSHKISYRGDSSASSPSSYSSRSCSTCRGRSSSSGWSESDFGRSRSPLSQVNRRAKLRERSRSRSPLARAGRKAKLRGRSRSRSPLDRAVKRVKSRERSGSEGRKRGISRRRSRKRSYERDDGRYRSRSCLSCESGSSHSTRSYNRSRGYGEGKGKEADQPRRLKSALVATKESVGMEGGLRSRGKVVQANDDVGRNFDAHEQTSGDRKVELDRAKHTTNTWVEDVACVKGDTYVLTKLNNEPSKNADVAGDDSTMKNSGDSVNASNSESDDLELVLRQKALENFRKFRGGLLLNTSTSSDQKDVSLPAESCKDADRLVQAKDAIISSKWKSNNSLERLGSIQRGSCMTQPRIRSVVNIPTENDNGNSVISHQNSSESTRPAVDRITTSAADGQITSNHLKFIEEPLDKVSPGKTLLSKDIRNKKAAAEPRGSTTVGTELKVVDGSTSGASACVNGESGNNNVEVDTAGSHFEQKTFSRMHDGEMVQVSYKVYIPKKSPALARRQLQQ